MIALVRVDTGTSRRRAAVERHRAIVVAAREASLRLGYRTTGLVLAVGDLPRLTEAARRRRCQGMLILSGLNEDVLRHFSASSFPCVYADVVEEEMAVRAVAPEYRQGVGIAMGRLLAAGFRKPGLVFDRDLSLVAREHLIEAYGLGVSTAGATAPPPFLTPTRPFDLFDAWFKRHAFDSLLTTDLECTRRLAVEGRHPVFGLDLNLPFVGSRAVEMLHAQIRGRSRR
jgi:DNA-binding LacI/PurR family transcriptional regulator